MATEFISNSWLMPTNANAEANRVSNYSLDFDGSSQYIDSGSFSALNSGTAMSVSLWFKGSTYITNARLISCAQFEIYQSSATAPNTQGRFYYKPRKNFGNPIVTLGGTSISGVGNLVDGNWHHICLTFDNSTTTAIVYEDGVPVITNTSASGPLNSAASNLYIGSSSASSNFFDGNITEVSIFDYALSASQVTELYGTGSAIGNPMSLTTKPVAYYPLGNSAFNGEFLATNNATELYENYALDYDGTNDYIDCGTNSSLDITGNITLSGWINRDDNLNSSNIIAKWNSGPTDTAYILRVTSSGGAASNSQIEMLIRNNIGTVVTAIESVGEVSINKWVHVLGTYDGSTIKVYYNGVELGSGTSQTGNIETSTAALKIGSRGTEYTDGKLSNVSIYNSALSAAQVTTLYNSGKPFDLNTFAVTPVSWWRLGASGSSFDGTNWTILDEISTSANNGTSANMTQADLVDGVGATGNGVSSGMSSGTNKTGDAPYSTKNAVSYNMSVTAESTSVPT